MIAKMLLAAGLALQPVEAFDRPDVTRAAFGSFQEAPAACREQINLAIDIGRPAPRQTTSMPRTANGLRAAGGTVQGLAKLSYDLKADIRFETTQIGNTTCVRVRHVAVSAGTVAPEIWIHPDVQRQQGSCRWRVTWDHEMEHVHVHYAYLSRLNQEITRSLPHLLRGLPPVEIGPSMRAETARAILQKRIMMELDAINRASADEARMQHARMDTSSEYHRLARKCSS